MSMGPRCSCGHPAFYHNARRDDSACKKCACGKFTSRGRTDQGIDSFLEEFGKIWKENRDQCFGKLCFNIMAESYKYYDFYDGSDEQFLERIKEYREVWMKLKEK